jgi:deoxycytidylate deaminase
MKELTIAEFKKILPTICDRETAMDAKLWTRKNPLWSHCAVVSLVAQNFFGGELRRASLLEVPEFKRMGSHYWNKLPDGSDEDFTRPQFGANYPSGLQAETRERSYLLSHPETVKRYKLLAFRLAQALNSDNNLFDDQIFQKCFDAALDSSCQKMKFGCVIMHDGKIVYSGCNKIIEPLRSMCEPKCIRFSIPSRTESMIGACGHAEELALWDVVQQGIPLRECELYLVGLYANGLPWLRQEAEHTCLRCSVQMYYARLKKIYITVSDHWAGITPEQALTSARLYAMGEKTV